MAGDGGTDRRERLEISGFPRLFGLALEAWANTLKEADRRHVDVLFGKAIGVNAKSVKNWRSAVSAPPAATWGVVKARLSAVPGNAPRVPDLEAAWERARSATHPEIVSRHVQSVAAAGEARFEAAGRKSIDPQLLDFAVSVTQGSTHRHIELAPTLDFGESPCEVDGVRFTIAVQRAKLVYDAPGCEPKPGSKFQKAPGCVVEGAAWVLTGPDERGLRGPLMGGEALVVLSASGNRADVRLHVRCDDESGFVVTAKSQREPLTASTERAAAHFLKLKACKRESDGTYRLASAGIRLRRAKE